MKNRDLFIDLVEEIDPRHLETHIKRNTDTRNTKIKRYLTAAGLYAAACVILFLLIPYIITHTIVDVPPHSPPGAEPVTTEPVTVTDETIDEFFADTKLYKVLETAGVKREDVKWLHVDRHQIINGDVYYRYGNGIYKNTESSPIISENSTLGEFRVDENNICYTVLPYGKVSPIQKPLYHYNTETQENKVVSEDIILYFGFHNGELIYVTADSEAMNGCKVYSYDTNTGKSEHISSVSAGDSTIDEVFFYDYRLTVVSHMTEIKTNIDVIELRSDEWINMYSMLGNVQLVLEETEEGYYYSSKVSNSDAADLYNGVFYFNRERGENEKVSSDVYLELYYVNGALVGVNREKFTLIVEKPENSIDEYFADTMLYQVLNAMELDRQDVARLSVGGYQIVNGDVYHVNDGIYKNTDDSPIFRESFDIDSFYVSGKYIFYTVLSEADRYPPIKQLYCYNTDTDEKTVICDDIYHYDVRDGELLYLTVGSSTAVKVYTYAPEENKSVYVCDIRESSNWIGDICCIGTEMAFITDNTCAIGQASVLDLETGNIRYLFSSDCKGVLSIIAAENGYYVSFRQVVVDENGKVLESNSEYDGVWYTKVSEKPVKISDSPYDELYFANGKLAGVSGDIVEAIDTDADEVIQFPDSRTRYNDEAHREIGSKVIEALDELYNNTVETNGGEVPKYLDPDFVATLTVRNYESVQRQTTVYDDKCHQVIQKALTDNLPEECIMSHIPSWEIANGLIADGNDIQYYVLDQSLIPDDVDREELTLYLEYRYYQDRSSSVDYSQYYDIDVKALESKYGNMGTVAVHMFGSWEYWNTTTGVQRPIEYYPDYLEISSMYYNFVVSD